MEPSRNWKKENVTRGQRVRGWCWKVRLEPARQSQGARKVFLWEQQNTCDKVLVVTLYPLPLYSSYSNPRVFGSAPGYPIKDHFPASFAYTSAHVTKFWPMGSEQKGKLFLLFFLFFSSILFSLARMQTLTVGAGGDTPAHEMEAMCWEWQSNKVKGNWIPSTTEQPEQPWTVKLML